MTTATKTRKSRSAKASNRQQQEANKADYIAQAEGPLLGNIITWGAGQGPHKHADVVKALEDCSLDTKVAREFLPKHAFNRAMKKMEENRSIDVVKEDGKEITFQFTAKQIKDGRWKFSEETMLVLNKDTGAVRCDISDLQKVAQDLLNASIENRTTSDITNIVQGLCEQSAALMSIRDQGGAYFVPAEHNAFLMKIETFLGKLGGQLNLFPIAATAAGKNSVQDTVALHLGSIIQDHSTAVEAFGIDTRAGTLERAAEEIRNTRVKIEAYAHYLGKQREALMEAIEEANTKLTARVGELTLQKETMTANGESTAVRVTIMGHSATSLVRWMARQGWDFAACRKCLDANGGAAIKDHSVTAQIGLGQRGALKIPEVTKAQAKKLKEAAGL